MGRRGWNPRGDARLIYPYLPKDSSAQRHAFAEALRVIRGGNASPVQLLDLGCGRGESRGKFLEAGLNVRWRGLDIEDSPEAAAGRTVEAECHVYDGVHIPFAEETFDVVYSRQTFEHVTHPRELVNDVARVLRKGGVFVGSCSALEPFHSRSICNFTPYGFSTFLRDAGLTSIVVRPGVDGLSLIARRLLGFLRLSSGSWLFEKESPLNLFLEVATRAMGFGTARRAAAKLLFCGHFVFAARKG